MLIRSCFLLFLLVSFFISLKSFNDDDVRFDSLPYTLNVTINYHLQTRKKKTRLLQIYILGWLVGCVMWCLRVCLYYYKNKEIILITSSHPSQTLSNTNRNKMKIFKPSRAKRDKTFDFYALLVDFFGSLSFFKV